MNFPTCQAGREAWRQTGSHLASAKTLAAWIHFRAVRGCAGVRVWCARACCPDSALLLLLLFSPSLSLSPPTFSSSTAIDLGRESHRLGLPLC